jgi:hypothetical protein
MREGLLRQLVRERFRKVKAAFAPSAAVIVVALAAGCGGGGGKKASVAPATTTTAAAAKSTTPAEKSKSSTPSFASAHNCAQLAALGAQVAKSLQTTSGDFAATVANEDKILQAMTRAVPSEIRGDYKTFADAFHTYFQAIAKLKLQSGTAPTAAQITQLANAAKSLSTAKLQAAEQHLSAWASKNCGVPTTTG